MLSKLYPMEKRRVKFVEKETGIYNKYFEYLLDNDPEKVISKFGVNARKAISPLMRSVAGMSMTNRLHIERMADIPSDRPVIFAPTHGFRDDIPAVINSIDRHAYLLYASLPHFFYSLQAIGLWLAGCTVIDRSDKESRKSAIVKIAKLLDMNTSVIMYPEGTWNKTPNLLVQKLYHGVHVLSKEKNALVVPIAVYEADGICHVIVDEAMDIGKYSSEEGLELLRNRMASSVQELMDKYAPIVTRQSIGQYDEYAENFLENLVATTGGLYDTEVENNSQFIDKNDVSFNEVFSSDIFAPLRKKNDSLSSEAYAQFEEDNNEYIQTNGISKAEYDESLTDEAYKLYNRKRS